MQGGFLLHDATHLAHGPGTYVALDFVQTLDHYTVFGRDGKSDFALLAFFFAGNDEYFVTFFHVHYSTSGASEMIRMNPRSRNSRATGPKIRVPRGLSSLLIMTAALSSKRMCEPSGRPYSL